jgi:hypothetical protein
MASKVRFLSVRLADGAGWLTTIDEQAVLHVKEMNRRAARASTSSDIDFDLLRMNEDMVPAPGFYARVMNRIRTQERPSIWSPFGESVFARRVAYGSATFLLLLSALLISSTPVEDTSEAELILAGDALPTPVTETTDEQRERELILVNLATYGGDGDRPQDDQ